MANKPLYVSRLSSSDNSRFFTRFNYVFEAIGKIQKESLKMLFDAYVNPEQIVSEPLYLRHCCLLVKIGNTKWGLKSRKVDLLKSRSDLMKRRSDLSNLEHEQR